MTTAGVSAVSYITYTRIYYAWKYNKIMCDVRTTVVCVEQSQMRQRYFMSDFVYSYSGARN